MAHLHVENALKVAKGCYIDEGLQVDFMAVATLNDLVLKATGQHQDIVQDHEGKYPVNALKRGLMEIVSRHQHSEEFMALIDEGRQLILKALEPDSENMLGDLKYWHDMSADARLKSCQKFADLLKDIFVSHVRLPPDRNVVIQKSNLDIVTGYMNYGGQLEPEIFTAQPFPPKRNDKVSTILVNTHPHSKFSNGPMTYAAIYGAYLSVIEASLSNCIVREKYADNLANLQHDIDLWDHASQQKAFVDPLIYDIHAMQFSNVLRNAEEAILEAELSHMVEYNSAHVPERIKLSPREKFGLLFGSVMGWNP